MNILQAIIYGFVQGVGEFLPISSSAHLIALPRLMGWTDPGLAFDVALHLGTLLAILVYFWQDWITLGKAGLKGFKTVEGKLFWYIIVASVPGALIGKLFEKQAETAFRNLQLIGLMLVIMAIVLHLAEKYGKKTILLEKMGIKESLWIGVSQALAIIPGVSRSGITMTSGLFLGLTRPTAARFSFLLSTPIVVGAGMLKLKDILHTPHNEYTMFAVGMIVSAVVGFLSIKFLLNYLQKQGFGIFIIYRIIFGIVLLLFPWLH